MSKVISSIPFAEGTVTLKDDRSCTIVITDVCRFWDKADLGADGFPKRGIANLNRCHMAVPQEWQELLDRPSPQFGISLFGWLAPTPKAAGTKVKTGGTARVYHEPRTGGSGQTSVGSGTKSVTRKRKARE